MCRLPNITVAVSWYRKKFTLPTTAAGHPTPVWMLEFEGTFHYTQIWINGHHVMDHSIGYTPYSLRLDNLPAGVLVPGQKAVLSLRADASYGSGHWYEGGGIRWDVNLVQYDAVHIARYGAFVTPQVTAPGTTPPIPARVEFVQEDAAVAAAGAAAPLVHAVFSLTTMDADAQPVASCTTAAVRASGVGGRAMGGGPTTSLACTMTPTSALSLWSVQDPTQYTARCDLYTDGNITDSVEWATGFRNATFTANRGLYLNGKSMKFRGFSHHDSFAGTGVAMPPRFDLFRANAGRMLGSNVWRMSHNPYHTPLYNILNALGTTVWDENRDLGPWYVDGMAQLVRRDRNHPSVLMWSFCNEYECGQNSENTGHWFRAAVRSEDTSRPTTSNVNGAFIPGVDVQGFSHRPNNSFVSFHHDNPTVPTTLSECCSCTSHRLPVSDRSPGNSCIRNENSPGLLPFNTGSLGVWTLFDYFGESQAWPKYACAFGQFDIAGSPKPHAFIYNINWLQLLSPSDAGRPPLPVEHVARLLDLIDQIPCGGKSCTVSAVSTGHSNELFVNNRSVGLAKPDELGDTVTWQIPFVGAAVTITSDAAGNCTFPHNLTGVQCKGLTDHKQAKTPKACEASCCAEAQCDIWQFEASAGCWIGTANSCDKVGPGWVGGGRGTPPGPSPPTMNVSSLTVVARDATGAAVARHTLTGSATGVPAALVSDIDIPSAATGTGTALVLDGMDSGLVRVTLVDADGALISPLERAVNVTFEIVSGPGRIVGVGSGDPAAHNFQQGNIAATFAGTVKAIVRVTVDCTTPGRELAKQIDVETGTTTIVGPDTQACDAFVKQPIVVRASSGTWQVMAEIAVSADEASHGYISVARATARDLSAYTYLRDFRG